MVLPKMATQEIENEMIHLSKTSLLNTITLGIRFQHMNFGGTHIASTYIFMLEVGFL